MASLTNSMDFLGKWVSGLTAFGTISFFFVLPLSGFSMLAAGIGLLTAVALWLSVKRINGYLGIAVAALSYTGITGSALLAHPTLIERNAVFVECDRLSIDCSRTHRVELFGDYRVIVPYSGEWKRLAYEGIIGGQAFRWRSIQTTRLANGRYEAFLASPTRMDIFGVPGISQPLIDGQLRLEGYAALGPALDNRHLGQLEFIFGYRSASNLNLNSNRMRAAPVVSTVSGVPLWRAAIREDLWNSTNGRVPIRYYINELVANSDHEPDATGRAYAIKIARFCVTGQNSTYAATCLFGLRSARVIIERVNAQFANPETAPEDVGITDHILFAAWANLEEKAHQANERQFSPQHRLDIPLSTGPGLAELILSSELPSTNRGPDEAECQRFNVRAAQEILRALGEEDFGLAGDLVSDLPIDGHTCDADDLQLQLFNALADAPIEATISSLDRLFAEAEGEARRQALSLIYRYQRAKLIPETDLISITTNWNSLLSKAMEEEGFEGVVRDSLNYLRQRALAYLENVERHSAILDLVEANTPGLPTNWREAYTSFSDVELALANALAEDWQTTDPSRAGRYRTLLNDAVARGLDYQVSLGNEMLGVTLPVACRDDIEAIASHAIDQLIESILQDDGSLRLEELQIDRPSDLQFLGLAQVCIGLDNVHLQDALAFETGEGDWITAYIQWAVFLRETYPELHAVLLEPGAFAFEAAEDQRTLGVLLAVTNMELRARLANGLRSTDFQAVEQTLADRANTLLSLSASEALENGEGSNHEVFDPLPSAADLLITPEDRQTMLELACEGWIEPPARVVQSIGSLSFIDFVPAILANYAWADGCGIKIDQATRSILEQAIGADLVETYSNSVRASERTSLYGQADVEALSQRLLSGQVSTDELDYLGRYLWFLRTDQPTFAFFGLVRNPEDSTIKPTVFDGEPFDLSVPIAMALFPDTLFDVPADYRQAFQRMASHDVQEIRQLALRIATDELNDSYLTYEEVEATINEAIESDADRAAIFDAASKTASYRIKSIRVYGAARAYALEPDNPDYATRWFERAFWDLPTWENTFVFLKGHGVFIRGQEGPPRLDYRSVDRAAIRRARADMEKVRYRFDDDWHYNELILRFDTFLDGNLIHDGEGHRAACDEGIMDDCRLVAAMYLFGIEAEKDVAEGVRFARMACDGDDMRSCNLLGAALIEEVGDEESLEEAAQLFTMACESDVALACGNLASMYEEGVGVSQNDTEAARLYRLSCIGGRVDGCRVLGILYREGRGVEQNNEEAFRLFRVACEAGDARSCSRMGWMYGSGLGVDRDYEAAAAFYRKACDGGAMNGCRSLGVYRENGTGIDQDYSKAAEFYRQACEGNFMLGCYDLGRLYSAGSGLAKDDEEASRLFRLACEGGNTLACDQLRQ